MASFTFPDRLAPGDLVVVVAPSGPCSRDELWRGLAWLRTRYRLEMSSGVLDREGYLAGCDERRAAELARAMAHPEAKAIVAARGGYGALRIASGLPWAGLARRPKWLVGFSDTTTLLAAAWAAGVASVHGPHVSGLGRDPVPLVRSAWIAALERADEPHAWRGLRELRAGHAVGPIVGGNLAILHALAAAGRLAIPPSAIVAIEEVGEAPYRIDRMLTTLVLGGHLRHASALVFGGFERCGAGVTPEALDALIVDRTAALGLPVLSGAPFGHGAHHEAFVVGATARVDGSTLAWSAR